MYSATALPKGVNVYLKVSSDGPLRKVSSIDIFSCVLKMPKSSKRDIAIKVFVPFYLT